MLYTEVFKTNQINSNLTCLELKALVRRKEQQDELPAWCAAAMSFSQSMLTLSQRCSAVALAALFFLSSYTRSNFSG